MDRYSIEPDVPLIKSYYKFGENYAKVRKRCRNMRKKMFPQM